MSGSKPTDVTTAIKRSTTKQKTKLNDLIRVRMFFNLIAGRCINNFDVVATETKQLHCYARPVPVDSALNNLFDICEHIL